MTQGGPNNATLFYVFYLYRTAFADGGEVHPRAGAHVLHGRVHVAVAVVDAAATMVIGPAVLFFLAAQRYFVQGITLTGIKG